MSPRRPARLPIVGRAFTAVFDAMANTAAIRKIIDGFRELDKTIQGAAQAAEDWHRSNAMKALQIGGAPGSVLGGATAQQEAAVRLRKIEEAAGVLRAAEAQRKTAQKALDDYQDSSRFLGIKGMPSAGFDEEFFGTTSALRGAVSRAEVLKTLTREALQRLQTEHGEAGRLAGAGVSGMAEKEHTDRLLAAYKAANELYDQQQREAADVVRGQADAARGQAETQAIIREAQTRGFMATADDRAKELRQIDDWFAEQQVRAKDHAGAMGAIQDSYHEQRAAAQKRFRESDVNEVEAWMAGVEAEARGQKGTLSSRVSAPFQEARFLQGGTGQLQDPAVESNRHLSRIAGYLERQERRETVPAAAGPTVRIAR